MAPMSNQDRKALMDRLQKHHDNPKTNPDERQQLGASIKDLKAAQRLQDRKKGKAAPVQAPISQPAAAAGLGQMAAKASQEAEMGNLISEVVQVPKS